MTKPDKQIIDQRFAICQMCPQFKYNARNGSHVCKASCTGGCYLPIDYNLISGECPLDKFVPSDDDIV